LDKEIKHESYFNKAENALSQMRILVVEDDEDSVMILQAMLGKKAKEIIVAVDGIDGLQKFRETKPDMVITDIDMPGLDGLQLSAEIRQHDSQIPVIISTAHTNEEFMLKAINIGINDYIVKPFHKNELLMVVSRFARIVYQNREIEHQRILIQLMLDKNPTYIVISDGISPLYMNRSFLNFLNLESYEQFRSMHETLDSIFVPISHGIDSLPFTFTEWFDARKDDYDEEHYIQLKIHCGPEEKTTTFRIHFFPIPDEDRYILFFTDVTYLIAEKEHYRSLATTDALTGITNRAFYEQELSMEIAKHEHYGIPLTMIIFDIDHFKLVNDTYGHSAGDSVLVELTRLVRDHIRKTDIFARFGGEEFIVLTPDCDMDCARNLAEKIRKKMAGHTFAFVKSITCSFGIATHRKGESAQSMFERADAALYLAKAKGKNRVEVENV